MRTLLIACLLLFAAPAAASACKCVVPGDPAEEIDAADGAAWAKVVKRTVLGQEAVRYRLKVIKDYKDNLPDRITVGARRSSAACGLELAEGNKIGLLLTRAGDRWTSSSCQVRTRAHLDGASSARMASLCASS